MRGPAGVFSAAFHPGGRQEAMGWTDDTQTLLYVFGGSVDLRPNGNYFNDLWVYDTSEHMWAWLSGENAKVSSRVCVCAWATGVFVGFFFL